MKKVLFVDEEKSSRVQHSTELRRAGYQVFGAKDWRAAVRLAQRERPDCLVVDISLLDLHGLGFIRNILSNTPSMPVILTSSCHDEKEEFGSWYAPAYMVKTSDLEALKQTLAKATGTRRAVPAA